MGDLSRIVPAHDQERPTMAVDHDARREFAAALVRRREATGLTQIQLRDGLLGLGIATTQQNVGKWEKGANQPDRQQMAAVEHLLGAPGLGLLVGIDTGGLRRLTDEVADLRDRVARLEGATSDGLVGELRVAAYEGGDAHTAPSPTDVRDRPRPPAFEPEVDPEDPGWDS